MVIKAISIFVLEIIGRHRYGYRDFKPCFRLFPLSTHCSISSIQPLKNIYSLPFTTSTTSSSTLSSMFTSVCKWPLINLFDQSKPFLDLRFSVLEWNKKPIFFTQGCSQKYVCERAHTLLPILVLTTLQTKRLN